jgi:hypothetical protein
MSYESEQENQEGQEGAENAEGAGEDAGGEDLNAALNGGGEMNFVTETKQPINKGTLIVVGLLIACGAATYFMYVRSGPAEAVAAGETDADKTITTFLGGSEQNVDQMRKMLRDTEKVVQQFRTQADATQVPLEKLATNPFMKEKPKPTEDSRALAHAEQVRLATTRANEALAELRLQTIIHRDPKKASCMINNTLYRKGQKITAGEGKVTYTVEDIRPDGVTITAPAVDTVLKFERKMKQ